MNKCVRCNLPLTPDNGQGHCEEVGCGESTRYLHSRIVALADERDAALDALYELVRLKDLHDSIELRESHGELVRSYDPAKVDYRNNKPKAWETARQLSQISSDKEVSQ